GLSYKPSTPVIEESQGIMLAKSLKDAGFAVVAHDPMALGPAQTVLGDAARFVPSAREALAAADIAVIVTPWPDYANLALEWVAHGRLRSIVDCWRQRGPAAFPVGCQIVRLGHQETIAAAGKRLAAE